MIRIRSAEIHKHNHTVKVNGEYIKLTSIEFDILYLLASNMGRVFSSEEILNVFGMKMVMVQIKL